MPSERFRASASGLRRHQWLSQAPSWAGGAGNSKALRENFFGLGIRDLGISEAGEFQFIRLGPVEDFS